MDNVPATPTSIGELRREFASWVGGTVRTTEGRLSDIVLVVYEAMAKTSRRTDGEPGVGQVSVNARYSHRTRSLRVTVHDPQTRAQPPKLTGDDDIDLIHALCDEPVITSTTSGTEIDLSWTLFA